MCTRHPTSPVGSEVTSSGPSPGREGDRDRHRDPPTGSDDFRGRLKTHQGRLYFFYSPYPRPRRLYGDKLTFVWPQDPNMGRMKTSKLHRKKLCFTTTIIYHYVRLVGNRLYKV